jgi:hypothetical protein
MDCHVGQETWFIKIDRYAALTVGLSITSTVLQIVTGLFRNTIKKQSSLFSWQINY